MQVNCVLAVFNLIPVPPLDGSWLLEHTLRGSAYNAYRAVRPYGMFLLIGILIFPPISNLLIGRPVHYVLGLMFLFSQWIASLIR